MTIADTATIAISDRILSGVSANVVLSGGSTNVVSLAVPASFNIVRSGGVETITVRTLVPVSTVVDANARPVSGTISGGIFSAPVAVTGVLADGVLSFRVAGAVTLANAAMPGNYQGVLTVIAQFN